MSDISQIPTKQLVKDLHECWMDAGTCAWAMAQGVFDYHGQSVQQRYDDNVAISVKISTELDRRGVPYEPFTRS